VEVVGELVVENLQGNTAVCHDRLQVFAVLLKQAEALWATQGFAASCQTIAPSSRALSTLLHIHSTTNRYV